MISKFESNYQLNKSIQPKKKFLPLKTKFKIGPNFSSNTYSKKTIQIWNTYFNNEYLMENQRISSSNNNNNKYFYISLSNINIKSQKNPVLFIIRICDMKVYQDKNLRK